MKIRKLIVALLVISGIRSYGQQVLQDSILHNKNSFYYLDVKNYPKSDHSLPIGIFDSGIGGLTVLDAIVNYDKNNNETMQPGKDGIIDFEKEEFIYLADQANMPYGNYAAENKNELLKEHIIKDVQFMLGNKYYDSDHALAPNKDKSHIKALVIACNTATAYGKESIEAFIKNAGLNIKVIGVIDAGVRGALEHLEKDENATIAVMATVGTVTSKGYVNTLNKQLKTLGYKGDVQVFQQGGLGIAEAVDEDAAYFNRTLNAPRESYKGPSINSNTKIDKTLLEIYNFDFSNNRMLCDTQNTDECQVLQINDAENYVRYHLVSLLEDIRKSKVTSPLKSIILGCTHYPYLSNEIKTVLNELYNYKEQDGSFRYQPYMMENIILVDPAQNTAKELFEHLKESDLFGQEGDIYNSKFYISVPNKNNPKIKIDETGDFTYEYKYGRIEGEIQEYIKVVPFSDKNISQDIYLRLENQLPFTFRLIKQFKSQD